MMQHQTLLVVDDKPDNLLVLQRVLSTHFSGCDILTASSAEEGLALAADNSVDCALIDVQMPGVDGIEMCRRLTANEATSRFPIIMITSRVGDKHRARAIELGVNDYLGKPYQDAQLLDAIRRQLEEKGIELP